MLGTEGVGDNCEMMTTVLIPIKNHQRNNVTNITVTNYFIASQKTLIFDRNWMFTSGGIWLKFTNFNSYTPITFF